ncbi:uncharacterized protein [Diabrotica undecimpunctata]|uniref:uncharacterized protein n=1 Tax=Diabrotica undecimpunctata TaxID=50387 RepID=UPI003B63BEB1
MLLMKEITTNFEFKFHPRIKNLTDLNFTEDEIKLLNYDLKHSVPKDLSLHDLESLSIETDIVIQNLSLSLSQRTSMRNSCCRYIIKFKNKISSTSNSSDTLNASFSHNFSFQKTQSQLKILKSIKHKISRHNQNFCKADKGNCLVILDRDSYDNKVSSFLDENHFTLIPTDPSKRFISKLKDHVKNHSEFLSNLPGFFLPGNPLISRLYGLPKIHKVGIPIRPVVSFINTSVSILSKFILNTLKNLFNFTPQFTVINSYQLVDKLQLITLNPDITMLSFDVSNLFTSVPKLEILSLVKTFLVNKSIQSNVISSILDIIELCLSQDLFQFNNTFYKQPDGLAMGSCLSPFLADVFMDHLESNHIIKNLEILHWFRYVI